MVPASSLASGRKTRACDTGQARLPDGSLPIKQPFRRPVDRYTFARSNGSFRIRVPVRS